MRPPTAFAPTVENVASSLFQRIPARSRRLRRVLAAGVLVVASLCLSSAWAQNDVLTQHNDVARTGQNLNETLLTPANVNANQFGKLFTQNVDGIVVGQPLYASQVLMGDGLVHNVVIAVTQNNTVYAFDGDTNEAPIWSVSLDDGGTPDPISDYGCKGTGFTQIGITSTPVIDPGKTTVYVVAKTLNGNVRQFSLHALDLTTGNELLGGPVPITGSYGSDTFNVLLQLQRPALLLYNGSVYIGFGGNGCDVYTYNGWLFAYDSQTLQQQGVFETAPNGLKASLWQGGAGPSVDEFGNIYVVTANGSYDGPGGENDYGDSVLKLGWNGTQLGILDYFTPYNQLYLEENDVDLGSAGALILPDQPGTYPHELVAGGKEGTLYLINRDGLGEYNPAGDQVIQSFPELVPFELTGTPSYWNSSLYLSGDRDYIKQFPLINGMLTSQPVSQTTVIFGGEGPASTSITANGTSNGVLWALDHSNHILYAFDPTNLANLLYDSTQALHRRDDLGTLIRFVTPTISNGKLYIGGKTSLTAYGLLPNLSPAAGNNQTGTPGEVLPTSLAVLASDSYSQAPIPGISVTCNDGSARGVFIPSGTQTTDSTGTATFGYQLPITPQVVTITCSNPGTSTTTFTETDIPGTPSKLSIVSGSKQSGPPNTPLPKPFVVKVVDANGVAVPGVTVAFTDNGAGGSFSPVAETAKNGRTSTQYTTGSNAGPVTVTASTTGVSSVNFVVTVQ